MLLSKYSTICYIIDEISVPNSNSPHPKEEVLNFSMALPFTCYRQYASCFTKTTKLNKLSLSISPPPSFPWKYIKRFPGGLTQETGSVFYPIAPWDRFKKLLPLSNFRRRLGQTHSFPKQSQSAIRRNTDPVAHVTQPQNSRLCATWPSFPFP